MLKIIEISWRWLSMFCQRGYFFKIFADNYYYINYNTIIIGSTLFIIQVEYAYQNYRLPLGQELKVGMNLKSTKLGSKLD